MSAVYRQTVWEHDKKEAGPQNKESRLRRSESLWQRLDSELRLL
jgi:hypothetical protein